MKTKDPKKLVARSGIIQPMSAPPNPCLFWITWKLGGVAIGSDGKVKLHEALVVFVHSSRWHSWFKEKAQ